MSLSIVFLTQLASGLFMTGVIWFVQVVHYPLFSKVGTEAFVVYERLHARLTTFVVGPAMILEIISALALWLIPNDFVRPAEAFGLVATVGLLWAVTFFWSVPQHTVLEAGFEAGAHGRLLASNVVRTILWTAKAAALIYLTARAFEK